MFTFSNRSISHLSTENARELRLDPFHSVPSTMLKIAPGLREYVITSTTNILPYFVPLSETVYMYIYQCFGKRGRLSPPLSGTTWSERTSLCIFRCLTNRVTHHQPTVESFCFALSHCVSLALRSKRTESKTLAIPRTPNPPLLARRGLELCLISRNYIIYVLCRAQTRESELVERHWSKYIICTLDSTFDASEIPFVFLAT